MKTTAQRVLMSTMAKNVSESNEQVINKPVNELYEEESENEQNLIERESKDMEKAENNQQNKDVKKSENNLQNEDVKNENVKKTENNNGSCARKDSDSSESLPGWSFNISSYLIESEEEDDEKIQDDEQLKAAIFDFDQTISVIHFYYDLHGYTRDSQLECLKEWTDDKVILGFGGKERIELLDNLFSDLKKASVELYVLSFGYKEVILAALERVNLAKYFDQNLVWGEAEVKKFRSETGIASQPKLRMIQKQIKEKHQLSAGEVLFVDDDDKNLQQSKKTVCKTIHVCERKGMREKEFLAVRREIKSSS